MIKFPRVPDGATHVLINDGGNLSLTGSVFVFYFSFFKRVDGVWYTYRVDVEENLGQWLLIENVYFAKGIPSVISELQAI